MTRNGINRIVTQQLNALISNGYTIDARAMLSRLVDVPARIDMRNGDDLLSIMITDDIYDNEAYEKADLIEDGIRISVVQFTEPTLPIGESPQKTLYEKVFIELGKNYYTDIEEAARAKTIRKSRIAAKRFTITNGYDSRMECGSKYKAIALRWIRKQPGMETCTIDEISKMERKLGGEFFNRYIEYRIVARGKTFYISGFHHKRNTL